MPHCKKSHFLNSRTGQMQFHNKASFLKCQACFLKFVREIFALSFAFVRRILESYYVT